jgi:hypothetical protein
MGNRKRFNTDFSPQTYEALRELAERRGVSMTAVLDAAIRLLGHYDRAVTDGARVVIQRDGREYEVLFW